MSRDAKQGDTFLGKPVRKPEFGGGGVTRSGHFIVVLAGNIYPEIRDELKLAGFRENIDYFDWWMCDDFYWPFDRYIDGVFVGKYTPIRDRNLFCIKSIGRFTSINQTLLCHTNHPLNTLSSSWVFSVLPIFDEEYQAKYNEKTMLEKDKAGTNFKVTIGNDVWIGANVFINASTVATIGDGAVIGAGSIVTRDVEPYAIVCGVPAKVQRYRYTPEQIEILLKVKWWNWDDDIIRENADLFINPEMFFERFK
jgi:aminocyclitol acetyltransferase